jgi:hypothetical protein
MRSLIGQHAPYCLRATSLYILRYTIDTDWIYIVDRGYASQPPPLAAIRLMASCEPKCTLRPATANTEPTVPTTFSDSFTPRATG